MRKKRNQRRQVARQLVTAGIFLAVACIGGILCKEAAAATDFDARNVPPCFAHPFGTDWMGRDMLARTLRGLLVSIVLGMLAAGVSACAALILGTAAALLGRWADRAVSFGIDMMLGVPHILLLILLCVAFGRGFTGVAAGIALTHWPSLARVIRAEVLQLKESPYIQIARKLGKGNWYIAGKHMAPHLLPQLLVGAALLFPHAVMHEASITFLGFGLSSEQPAIGNVLSESMKYLVAGSWWLAFFPGALLVLTVRMIYISGESLRRLADPGSAHE